MEIIVIGTEPPCIRSQTTFKRAKEVAQQFPRRIEVRKLVVHSEEAKKYGKVEGGYEISQVEKVDHDHEGIERLMQEIDKLTPDEKRNRSLIESKMQEIQGKLTPVTKKAEEAGYLMTPVVVVNGRVKAKGYAPDKKEIRKWVESELKQ